jgi:hypothetical protein
MSVLKNLTKVVKGKLDKLIHKQNGSHDFLFYFIHYNIIIVQVIETDIIIRINNSITGVLILTEAVDSNGYYNPYLQ